MVNRLAPCPVESQLDIFMFFVASNMDVVGFASWRVVKCCLVCSLKKKTNQGIESVQTVLQMYVESTAGSQNPKKAPCSNPMVFPR